MLVSCQSAQIPSEPIEIPPLVAMMPTRPTLERLPTDNTSQSLKTQTINVSRLVKYASDWEKFFNVAENYYQTVMMIIQGQGNPLE